MEVSKKMQLIDSEGEFREQELKDFVSAAHVDSTSDYQVVAIMGPQSSGKSTLMNHVVRACEGSKKQEGQSALCWIARSMCVFMFAM